jgi:hypothetical protein
MTEAKGESSAGHEILPRLSDDVKARSERLSQGVTR